MSVCWLLAASAGPLNDPFLGIVTSWRWLGVGINAEPPNLKGRGRGWSLETVLPGEGKGHTVVVMGIQEKDGAGL